MLNLKKLTISRKISLLSICALFGMLIIIATGVAFFGKIGQISDLAVAGKDYEIFYHKASAAFQQYVLTGESNEFDAFLEAIDEVNSGNGAIPLVVKLFQTHDNEQDVYKAYMDKYGDDHYGDGSDLLEVIGLVKALQRNPILTKLVANCEQANKLSVQWLQLGRQYGAADDAGKAAIQKQVITLRRQLETKLAEFLGIVGLIGKSLKSTVINLFIAIAAVMMVVLFTVTFFVARSILKPLKETVAFAKAISLGDLRRTIVIKNKDELGDMGESLNKMSKDLGRMLGDIKLGTETLSSSSTELSAISDQLSNDTRDTSGKATDVAAATDSMSDSMHAVATAMEQATDNTSVVAAAAEQMSSTIDEISQNAERARVISEDANGKTSEATVRMNELGQAAEGIGKVIETITDISEQVNLLALNATIEAARAGEAGKGFAVVANEIKELARQTAEATQDIKQKIQTIQDTTATTISQTQDVTVVIGQVNDVIAGIATAVEEQSAATREIASNIHKTSTGIQEVSGHVSNTSKVAGEINNAISEVNQSASQMAASSDQVNQSSADLANLAEQLNSMASRFKL